MKTFTLSLALLGMLAVIGCTQSETTESTSANQPEAGESLVDSNLVSVEEPEGAKDVIAVRESAQDGDNVVITGRIGGSTNPWIDGRLAFSIVDGSLKACSDIPGDGCKTPWDYCCETDKLPGATALVKIVDADGKLLSGDAKQTLNVKELSRVVVKGKAQRDDDGNLTVVADSVYVKE